MQILQIETSAEPVLANHAAETAEFAQKTTILTLINDDEFFKKL